MSLVMKPMQQTTKTSDSEALSGASMQSAGPDQMENTLRRGLSSRHLQTLGIGGSIGTGLFVASGGSIAQAGPGGALVAFGAVGLMVYLLMQSLGEMTAKIPVAGSFQT